MQGSNLHTYLPNTLPLDHCCQLIKSFNFYATNNNPSSNLLNIVNDRLTNIKSRLLTAFYDDHFKTHAVLYGSGY